MAKKETYNIQLISIQLISILLITLWVYTALNKAMDINLFRSQLIMQPFPSGLAGILIWFLPAIELLVASLLMFSKTKKAGMLLSFLLMLVFTSYVALAVIGYWENIPCSCGGVLNQLGWKDHLWFNLFFTALSATGIYLLRQSHRKEGLQQAALSGGPAKGQGISHYY